LISVTRRVKSGISIAVTDLFREAYVKILVTVKRVPDPEQKVKIKDNALDLSGMNFVVNPFDEYAVEAALRLTEKANGKADRIGEVIVVGIGPKDMTQQLRQCLAMGADRAILVDGDDDELDSEQVARIVKAVYEKEQPDMLLMGKQTVDGDNNQVPQLVAGYLGLPQATFAATMELGGDKKSVVVGREIDGGTEKKRVPLPSVVSVDLRIVLPQSVKNGETDDGYAYPEGPRYASLKGIMKAKKKPLESTDAGALGVELSPRVKVHGLDAPPERGAGIKVESVDELVEKLQSEAKVL
jgi:electron transfer flavoprotein beta subunit